jgi:phosphohistidine phosphatase SixA
LGLSLPMDADPMLYLASPDVLLHSLQDYRPEAPNVLLIGHNPGISELVQQLTGSEPPILLRTAGLCQIDFSTGNQSSFGSLPFALLR